MAGHVIAITHIHGIAGRRSELRALMRDTETRTAAEPGCRLYRFDGLSRCRPPLDTADRSWSNDLVR